MTAPQCSGPSLGIDIGGTKTQAVLLDASSRVIANRVRRTDRGPDGVVGGALALARECLQLGRTQVTELMGVGVGIPGQVDHCSGVVLHAVNLGIERLELGALLSAELGVAVRVDNDVKATALGAADYLRTPTADLSYINLGTGIASATLVGGRLVRGEGNLAGEIGHLPVDPSAGRCVCGQIGCLEVLAGGRRIAERLAAEWKNSGTRIDYIPEYFNWKECGEFLKSQGIIETPEGYHDDPSISSIMATIDPQSIRLEQRRKAGLAKINGVSFDPPSKAIDIGNRVTEFRANATVAAINKLLGK